MHDLLPVTPLVLAVAALVTFASSTLQATIGFGFAVVSVPLLSLVDPSLVPVPQLLLCIPLTLSVAWRERHAIDVRAILWIVAGRVPGAALGVLLLKVADQRVLDVFLASCVLVAVVALTTDRRIPRGRPAQLGAGTVSGVMDLVSSMGGPPVALLYKDDSGETVRANLGAIFSIGLFISLTGRVVSGEIATRDVTLALWLAPAVGLGFWASRYLTGRAEGRPLRIGILVVASGAALALLHRALS